jgi:hypothetical protein
MTLRSLPELPHTLTADPARGPLGNSARTVPRTFLKTSISTGLAPLSMPTSYTIGPSDPNSATAGRPPRSDTDESP